MSTQSIISSKGLFGAAILTTVLAACSSSDNNSSQVMSRPSVTLEESFFFNKTYARGEVKLTLLSTADASQPGFKLCQLVNPGVTVRECVWEYSARNNAVITWINGNRDWNEVEDGGSTLRDGSSILRLAQATGSSGSIQPPVGSHIQGEAWLPACGGETVACALSLNASDTGCAATNGSLNFSSLQGGNNCMDGLTIRAQICRAGLNPSSFKSACFVKNEAPTPKPDPLTPPAGSIKQGSAWLPACGESVACPMSLNANDVGCAATNGNVTFKSLEGGNNCSDGLSIQAKICRAGLNPASFRSACYIKR